MVIRIPCDYHGLNVVFKYLVTVHSTFIRVTYEEETTFLRLKRLFKIEKIELAGLIVLFIGVILLAFTFYSAYLFLIGKLNILTTGDLLESFGGVLAPLIEAVIRILYLGIMGWIGSIVTIRAVQLLKKEKEPQMQTPKQQPQPKTEPKQSANPSPALPVPAQETPKEAQKDTQAKQ